MANRRLANSITKKLINIDLKAYREWMKEKPNDARIQDLDQKKTDLVKQAKKRGLKMVNVPVADGNCIYWETNRTTKHVTFEWMYGGPDDYVSSFGDVVLVPVKQANKMIKAFKPEQAV